MSHFKNNAYESMDLTDIISVEKHLQSIVNNEYKKLLDNIHETHLRDHNGANKVTLTINTESWLNNVAVDLSLNYLIKERTHLDGNTFVLKVFSSSVLIAILEKLLYRSPSIHALLKNAFFIPTKSKLLEWFLDFSLAAQSLCDFSKSASRQIIIPFSLDSHFSVAVIYLTQGKFHKLAEIQYYNSFGEDLDIDFQFALKRCLAKRGFIPKYENVSALEQKDKHNCGIFIIYKAIELASHNVGAKETLLPLSTLEESLYLKWFEQARCYISHILHLQNMNVCLSIN
jgi:hypothetical protein